MSIQEIVRLLAHRPAMMVSEPTYGAICAFLLGFDLARDEGPLAGFEEWLRLRMNGGTSVRWKGIVRILAVPDVGTERLTPEDDQKCITHLLKLLEEYIQYRDEYGLTKVYYDYAQWLLGRGSSVQNT